MIPAATENFCRPYMALSSKIVVMESHDGVQSVQKQPHHLAASQAAKLCPNAAAQNCMAFSSYIEGPAKS